MERWNNSFLHTEIAPNDLSKTNNNNNSSAANNKIIKIKNINQSLIVDVEQTAQNDGVNNKKLTCNLVTPIDPRNEDEAKRSTYDVVSAYDAEFTPLRAQDEADTHFVLVVDEANGGERASLDEDEKYIRATTKLTLVSILWLARLPPDPLIH